MEGSLQQSTKEEQVAVIRFLWAEGNIAPEIHQRIAVLYGNSSLSLKKVYDWVDYFRDGNTEISGDIENHKSRKPVDKIGRAREMILQNRRITPEEIAEALDVSPRTAAEIAFMRLGFTRVNTHWVKRNMNSIQRPFIHRNQDG